MKSRNNRRWKFEAYQKEQRAVHKLVADVLDGVDIKESVVVAWGNGSFGPTSRGHDSTPNKKLRRSLSHYVPIVLVDAYNTSKKSCLLTKCSCFKLKTIHIKHFLTLGEKNSKTPLTMRSLETTLYPSNFVVGHLKYFEIFFVLTNEVTFGCTRRQPIACNLLYVIEIFLK